VNSEHVRPTSRPGTVSTLRFAERLTEELAEHNDSSRSAYGPLGEWPDASLNSNTKAAGDSGTTELEFGMRSRAVDEGVEGVRVVPPPLHGRLGVVGAR
jgi:hypothetical protein